MRRCSPRENQRRLTLVCCVFQGTEPWGIAAQWTSERVPDSDAPTWTARCQLASMQTGGGAQEQLYGQPVALFLSVHAIVDGAEEVEVGRCLVPAVHGDSLDHWIPLVTRTGGLLQDAKGNRACVRLGYAYHAEAGKDPLPEHVPYSLAGRAAAAAASAGKQAESEVGSHRQRMLSNVAAGAAEPPAHFRAPEEVRDTVLVPAPGAVRAIKAIAARGFQVVAVGIGNHDDARRSEAALRRIGLLITGGKGMSFYS